MKNFFKRAIGLVPPENITKSEWYRFLAMFYFYAFHYMFSHMRDMDMEDADTYLSWGDWFRLWRHEWKHGEEGTYFLRGLDSTEKKVFFYWLKREKNTSEDNFTEWRKQINATTFRVVEFDWPLTNKETEEFLSSDPQPTS